jgi:hypothetical protein
LSATLIVTAANDFTRRIHDRMPVLFAHHDLDAWLTGKAGVELLRPAPNDALRMWPVSKRVHDRTARIGVRRYATTGRSISGNVATIGQLLGTYTPKGFTWDADLCSWQTN